jgi:GNAT superfamily N-acetyltransferase
MVEIHESPASTYDDLVAMWHARCPDLDGFSARNFSMPEMWRQVHARTATQDGRRVGWGFAGDPTFAPDGWWMVHVVVPVVVEDHGIGRALYDALRALEPPGTVRVIAQVFDDDDRSLEVATHWGFVQAQHAINSRLPLTDLPEPVLPADVTIDDVPLLEVPDPDGVDAMLLASQTNPEASMARPLELAEQQEQAAAFAVPTGHVLRVDGAPAGICQGEVEDGVLQIVYTGIHPDHRGRGLARLLKQHAHRYGAARGATESRTNNEATNTGIRHVNESLGYRRVSGTRRLALEL